MIKAFSSNGHSDNAIYPKRQNLLLTLKPINALNLAISRNKRNVFCSWVDFKTFRCLAPGGILVHNAMNSSFDTIRYRHIFTVLSAVLEKFYVCQIYTTRPNSDPMDS